MTAKVSREFSFQSALHFNSMFLVNTYLVTLIMEINTEDIREQNIALERIRYLVETSFDNCMFIYYNDKAVENYAKAGIKVCLIPDEPYDQVIGAVLMSKFNIVTEGKIVVTEIQVKSAISDNVVFYISIDDNIEFEKLSNVWWQNNNASVRDIGTTKKREKIVELKKEITDWNLLGLSWKEKNNKTESGEILFIQLDK